VAEESLPWKVVNWVWDRKDDVARALKGVYAWFRGSGQTAAEPAGILIIGPGGTGKTTLARILSGEYDSFLDRPGEFKESINIERYKLGEEPETEVVVPPGQHHRRDVHWGDVCKDLGAGKYRGVIVTASGGYHTLGPISYKRHKLYQGDKDDFLKAFLEQGKADEVAVLKRLAPYLAACPRKLWMLTLVAKQDLWWPTHADLEGHYREGEYGAEILAVQNKQGHRQFRHEFAFASLLIGNFKTGVGEMLQPNVAGYDHALQVESLRKLFEVVDALKSWESST
jgi:hypothetical protein